MFRKPEEWAKIRLWLVGNAPPPNELAKEGKAAISEQIERIKKAIAEQRQFLTAFAPDAIVFLASDNGRLFTGVQVPQFCTYLAGEVWGSARLAEVGEEAEGDIIRLKCAPELASYIHQELVYRGFDLNYSKSLNALGQPEYGAMPSLLEPARALLANMQTPLIPIYINTRVPPCPSGHRLYDFGRNLAEVLDERVERFAVVAAGGLSHDHHRSRAGWIDRPLDEWVLKMLARGKSEAMKPMFDVESDALRGGGAELRLWLVVAAALESCGAKASVLDYFPSYSAATGIGFACWTGQGM